MVEKDPCKIIFFGTPDFAVNSLDKLCKNFNVVAVVTAVDKPQGRYNKIIPSAVKEYALNHSLHLLQPEKLHDENFLRQLDELDADLFVVVAFRMLPKCVWQKPKLGTVNLHGSLLPKYRGAAPINWALIKGEKKTGVTTFFINEDIDTGKIILQDSTKIFSGDNFQTLYYKLKILGAKTLVKTVKIILEKNFKPKEQTNEGTCEAPKIAPKDCVINFDQKSEDVFNFIRGMFPNAWFLLQGTRRCKILEAYPIDLKILEPGEIFANKKFLYIGTRDGVLSVEKLQLEGKKEMDIKSFLAGNAKLL
ncbi:MAG: methionyl-tRNA formyltransferase [Cytophagales bacterium]|jgi:methionyl-tRNA formyltransferase|nr:methionyl-tRNA formyltransferase [Cytophagales bacterium]